MSVEPDDSNKKLGEDLDKYLLAFEAIRRLMRFPVDWDERDAKV